MKESKSLSLRLPLDEYIAFDAVCREKGYSKTGKIREFIRNLIKQELESVKISAQEWTKIERGIEEIQKGEYVTFEELKRDIKTHQVADNKNIK
jgi:predicted transcriptional regulator